MCARVTVRNGGSSMALSSRSLGRSFTLVAILLLLSCGLAQSQDVEGTWRLVMRKLQDGTTQTPPAVQGAATWHNGLRHLIVGGYTSEGKLICLSLISN